MYRAIKRGYAVVAIGTHLSQAAFNFHCFNTTWPPEDHIEGPEVCMRCCRTPHTLLHHYCSNPRLTRHIPRYCQGRALESLKRLPVHTAGEHDAGGADEAGLVAPAAIRVRVIPRRRHGAHHGAALPLPGTPLLIAYSLSVMTVRQVHA